MPDSSRTALLVPVYNGTRFIVRFDQCLRKLTQGFDEVLFFDDGSTDGSAATLRSLGHTVIQSQRNVGQAAARNALLTSSSAQWVHFHDIDDLLLPAYLTDTTALATDAVDAVICDADWLAEQNGALIKEWKYDNQLYAEKGPSYLLSNPVGGINGLYRRTTLLSLDGFDETLRIWEDSDLNLRLALSGKKIIFTETVLVQAFRQEESVSANSHLIRKYQCTFLEKYLAFNEPVFNEELKKEANKLFHQIVYTSDWALYTRIRSIFSTLQEQPPLTNNRIASAFKRLVGPKWFTLAKMTYLTRFLGVKINKSWW